MGISLENLDKRICDVEDGATNEQTYREFINNIEEEFNIDPQRLDEMSDDELVDYLNFLDDLCLK